MSTLQIINAESTIGRPTYSPFEQSVLGFLAQAHLSKNTRRAYLDDVKQYIGYCQDIQLDPTYATRGHLDTYTRWMQDHPARWAESTISRRIGTVCGVYKYGAGEELLVKDPSARVKRPRVDMEKQKQTYLTPVELGIFVKYVMTHATTEQKALVAVLGLRGLRIAEALSLQISDLHEQDGFRTVSFIGKGGRARTAVIPPPAIGPITDMIGDRTHGPILLNHRQRPLDRGTTAIWLKTLAKEAGVDFDISNHSMRRSYATMASSQGVPIEMISESLGHSQITTTMRYLKQRGQIHRDISTQVAGAIVGLGGKS